MHKVKIGFLGCGFMGQLAHMQNYARLDDCEIVAVADSKLCQARMVAAAYGIPNVYDNYSDMLSNLEIDAVVAAQPFTNHVNVVPDILNAGKHVFTEKPLCVYAEHGTALVEAAKKSGKIHMVGYHKRSDPATEYAKNIIDSWKSTGEMGKMKYVRITMPPGDWVGGCSGMIRTDEPAHKINPEPVPDGISEKTNRLYNGFVNYYIHQVNLMRYLMGEDYKLTFADRSGVLMAVESKSGICGTIEMAPYSTSDDWQEKATVCFEKGWISIELPAPLASQQAGKVTVFTDNGNGGIFTTPRLKNVHAMKNQAMNFIKAVKGEKAAPCLSDEALRDLEIAMDYIQYKNINYGE